MGWLIFMGNLIHFSVKDGRPLSTEEVEETARQAEYRNASFSTYRFRGKTWGRGFADSFSLAEAKRAGKGWWKDPRWRRNLMEFLVRTAISLDRTPTSVTCQESRPKTLDPIT